MKPLDSRLQARVSCRQDPGGDRIRVEPRKHVFTSLTYQTMVCRGLFLRRALRNTYCPDERISCIPQLQTE